MARHLISEALISGVRIETMEASIAPRKNTIVFVHGGCQGSWAFEHFQPYLADRGWTGHALNWFGHNGSKALDEHEAVRRGIADVATEIAVAASLTDRPPILVAHSMGGLAALKYAELYPVAALALVAPVVPAEAKASSVEIPVDGAVMWELPSFEVARHIWFDGMDEAAAARNYARRCAESPRCVYEATRFSVNFDPARVTCPVLAIGAELDKLVPPAAVQTLANLIGAAYREQPGRGHNLLSESRWEQTAKLIADWLDATLPH